MALITLKYGLPILLGYILFVGISAQFVPYRRPAALALRPNWFLGIWVGIAVSAILITGMHMAYQMDLADIRGLAKPIIMSLMLVIVSGLLCYLAYSWHIAKQIRAEQETDSDDLRALLQHGENDHEAEFEGLGRAELLVDADDTQEIAPFSIKDDDTQTIIWNEYGVAMVGPEEQTRFDKPITALDKVDADASMNVDTSADNDAAFEANADADPDATLANAKFTAVLKDEPEQAECADSSAEVSTELQMRLDEIDALRAELKKEGEERVELENHLRATRIGLSELESQSRNFEADKATALTELEQELQQKVKSTAAAQARAEREAVKRAEVEAKLLELRTDLLKASNEARTSTEARAQALSTANKATTFARQAMSVRSKLEAELHEAQESLNSRQETISSLVKALEKEKRRTQTDVTAMAKQLILHEKQLQARRSLEEVSRSVDNKFTTRLVKKVARSRPLNTSR